MSTYTQRKHKCALRWQGKHVYVSGATFTLTPRKCWWSSFGRSQRGATTSFQIWMMQRGWPRKMLLPTLIPPSMTGDNISFEMGAHSTSCCHRLQQSQPLPPPHYHLCSTVHSVFYKINVVCSRTETCLLFHLLCCFPSLFLSFWYYGVTCNPSYTFNKSAAPGFEKGSV